MAAPDGLSDGNGAVERRVGLRVRQFAFSNESGRPRGPFVSALGKVLPGVARVQDEVPGFAAYWEQANRAALTSDGPLWVALGDSLTLGIGASAPERGWVGQVLERLATHGQRHRLVNLGISGATTTDVLEREVPVLDTLDAQLVTVMIGSNDLMRPARRRALPDRFADLLHRLPAGSLVATMPNPTPPAVRANEVLAEVAAERGLVVIETRDRRLASWRGRLAEDHFHPNDEGYAAMADVLFDAISRAARGSAG